MSFPDEAWYQEHHLKPGYIKPGTVCVKCNDTELENLLGGTMSWLIGYSPVIKDGVLHDHNPNRAHDSILCRTCGHRFEQTWFWPCSLCGWVADKR